VFDVVFCQFAVASSNDVSGRERLAATPLDGKPQCVTIAGEVRRLSPPSINVLQWLFDHDPTSLRALYAGLAPHHGPDAIETALRELLRSGFLVVSPGD
jgi:hypothetical protein